jgi:hypothetical protein
MVNKSAILGSLMGLVCLFLPWWQYKASGMGLNFDLTINPWGYGGSVSDLANTASGIGSLGSSGFSALSGTLGVSGLLVIAGSLIGLSSSLVRGSWGRGSVALAGILSMSGVVVFYSALGQAFAAVGVAATGSTSLTLYGYSYGSMDWGWTYGLFLGGLASLLLLIGVGTHPGSEIVALQQSPLPPSIPAPVMPPRASGPIAFSVSPSRYTPAQQPTSNLVAHVMVAGTRCPRCSRTASRRAVFCNRCGSRLLPLGVV